MGATNDPCSCCCCRAAMKNTSISPKRKLHAQNRLNQEQSQNAFAHLPQGVQGEGEKIQCVPACRHNRIVAHASVGYHAWLLPLGDGQAMKIYLVITLHQQYIHSCSNFHITIIFLRRDVPFASNRNAARYSAGAGCCEWNVERYHTENDYTPHHPSDRQSRPSRTACEDIRAHNSVIDQNHQQHQQQAAASDGAATAPHTYRN